MKKQLFLAASLLLLMLFSACNPEIRERGDDFPLDVVNLQITPTLEHWLPKITGCADGVPEFGLYTQVLPQSEIGSESNDLVIRLGERMADDAHVVVLGMETLSVIGGSEVPLSSLRLESLQMIFSGEISNWGQVPELLEDDIEIDQPIQTLSYPDEHHLRLLFDRIFLEQMTISSQPIVFSTNERLSQLMEDNPYAIGYLLQSQSPDTAKIMAISGLDPQATQQLVLAVTPQVPQGKLRQFLLCLQEAP